MSWAIGVAALLATTPWIPPDLTGTAPVDTLSRHLELRVSEKGGLAAVGQPIGPDSAWSVTDYGNVSVIRDVNATFFGSGSDFFKVAQSSTQAVDAYYEAHPDADPQFVLIILDWMIQTGGAFYMPVSNDVQGLGSGNSVFDSDPTTSLEGLVWLNGLDIYTTPGYEEFMAGLLFGQEFGHRWLSFVRFRDSQGTVRNDLLGRQDAHWSYYLDTDWSWVEGNDWTDNGDGTFTTANETFDSVTHYSDLDLYLMGFIDPADVAPMTLITPDGGPGAADPPAAWFGGSPVTVDGTSETVTMDMILDVEGERSPAADASQRDFDLAVVYLLRKNDRVDADTLGRLETVLSRFKQLWEQDVLDLASVDFSAFGTANEAPKIAVTIPESGEAGRKAKLDASGTADPEGYELTYIWDLGDGETRTTTEPVLAYAYDEEGLYNVELRVVDAHGAEAFAEGTISVAEARGCACAVAPKKRPVASGLALALLALAGVALRRRR